VNSTNFDFFDELNSRYNLDLKYPEDNIPVENVSVFVYTTDSLNKDILVSQVKSKSDGTYKLDLDMGKNYSLVVKNYGFFDKKISISTKAIDCTDTILVGITSINYIPEITVRVNVYYEHDKSRLTSDAKMTIDTAFMPLFDLIPNAIIEIGSHTDSTGSDSYNMKLSQRRSESVVNYLVGKGMSVDRLVAKGYGESVPIAPNSNPDGTDNPANRQLNRRTELRIVGEISSFYINE
jgi:outer membrane protein OmpA-like peptidoglycan-associated protein